MRNIGDHDVKLVRRGREYLLPTKIPTDLDIAWAAGIYEGEGSCNNSSQNPARITICQHVKNRFILDKLRDLFGGSIGFKELNIYYWIVCGNLARKFVNEIYPFLSPWRTRQIDMNFSRKRRISIINTIGDR